MRVRHRRRRLGLSGATTAGVVVLGLVLASQPAAAGGTPMATRPAVAQASGQVTAGVSPVSGPATRWAHEVSVTLITGDRVVVSAGGRQVRLVPGEGRDGIRFATQRVDGRLYVIPSDAATLVASGRLDRRLFDVTGLVAARYDDAHRSTVPLIVEYAGDAAQRQSARTLAAAGAQDAMQLSAIDATAVEVGKQQAETFWAAIAPSSDRVRTFDATEIERVWLDGVRRPVLTESVPQIGAPKAWEAGYTGEGVTVAVIDTGIDASHPDLDGKVAAAKDFTEEGPGDGFGHGTHVASTIAGTGAASDGRYTGVAPDASLVDAKVCTSDGWCEESAILAGMQWAAVEQKAKVANLSLGGQDTPEVDPLEQAVDTLTEQTGTLFVIAAGNEGPGAQTVGSPASADAALAVGAVDKSDEIAEFSSRGPRIGDLAIKPDVTAPGVDIVAAKAAGTEMGDPVGEHYVTASGTSMATPHVAGAAALLAQQHPDWTASELKPTLMASATPHPELSAFGQGAGRVDLAQAIAQTVTADPVSLSFGVARWPHDDDTPVTEKLTYHNHGDTDLTLSLTASMTGPDGEPAPASAVDLSATSLTVPAGGTASVDVTANTAHDGPDGTYSGHVTATVDNVSVSTPIAVTKEVESYDLTVEYLDRAGKPAPGAWSYIYGLDEYHWEDLVPDEQGVVKLRLPKGRYFHQTTYYTGEEESSETVMMVRPQVTLNKDVTMTVDMRKAKPVTTTVERSSARPGQVDIGVIARGTAGDISDNLFSDTFEGLYTGHVGPPAPKGQFTAYVQSQWLEPGPEGDFANSPYHYGLVDYQQRRFFTGFQREVRDRDLVKVNVRYAEQKRDRHAARALYGFVPGESSSQSQSFGVQPPTKVTLYLDPDPVRWSGKFDEYVIDDDGLVSSEIELSSTERAYQVGRRYAEQWNKAVFGPAFPGDYPWSSRSGDELWIDVPMYSDAAGHEGFSRTDSARTVLYRDGVKVAESELPGLFEDVVTVPAARASFRLEVSASRPSFSPLSTQVESVWTFGSGRTREQQALPLWAVRFAPKLDQRNRSREGVEAMVPVVVAPQAGAPVGVLRQLVVQVSTDDGATWRKARMVAAGPNRWVAVVEQPEGTRYVSLRAEAVDSKGNAVTHTIIRAYAVGS